MRKTLMLVLSIFMVASLCGTASAWTLRVRHDPDERDVKLWDIRTVSSDLTASQMSLGVSSWGRLSALGLFMFSLDTNGTKAIDRAVLINRGNSGRMRCLVVDIDVNGPDVAIGSLRAGRPNHRSVSCVIPRSWFPRIHRAVRFYVRGFTRRGPVDRAPNHGVYRWV